AGQYMFIWMVFACIYPHHGLYPSYKQAKQRMEKLRVSLGITFSQSSQDINKNSGLTKIKN
ncbi:hypothetical protein ACJX0J_029925, partial [Zea mays]